jgi:hypothetical protein
LGGYAGVFIFNRFNGFFGVAVPQATFALRENR